jgi:acetyltransferase-like isoleucine patch superfamily enzyme
MNLRELFLIKNNCYVTGKNLTPTGIMVHSTGVNNPALKRYVGPDDGFLGENRNNNHWNQPKPDGREVCVHAFIGKLADGTIAAYQTLPWDMRGWHAGGNANNTHVGFEICEDNTNDADYFDEVYREAVELCAMLCRKYGIKPEKPALICHSEGNALGIASAHSDVMHWFPKHGKNMDIFRADVKRAMEGAAAPVPEPPGAAVTYRVRKTWKDSASQTGAYRNLDNAKAAADEKKADGYKVFDESGAVVYDPAIAAGAPAGRKRTEGGRSKRTSSRAELIPGVNDSMDPNTIFPVPDCKTVIYVKPAIKNKNIIVGDFTYFCGTDFENHVTHHYDFYGDRLIIGKFCQIAKGVEFIMNGANHKIDAVSAFPFHIFEGWKQHVPSLSDMPSKGDTVVGNDVCIGRNAVILPGVHIGDGAVIGANSVVGSDIEPYTIAAGDPAEPVDKRFDDELISLLLELKWWDLPVEEISRLIPLLRGSNLKRVKNALKKKLAHARQHANG